MTRFNSILTQNIKERFRGFLPVVIDIETGGVQPEKHALLEICVVFIEMDDQGKFHPSEHYFEHILPFDGAELDPSSLKFNGIDPYQPLRFAVDEQSALERLFQPIRQKIKATKCQRAVLVGHNAWFDLLFLKAAINRTKIKSPFHDFTCFDTATLGGMLYGQTVLLRIAETIGIEFDVNEAHSAIYDAKKTAEIFCFMLNDWHASCEVPK